MLSLLVAASSYAPVAPPRGAAALPARTRPAAMVAADVVARKAKLVDEVKATLCDTSLMFCVRSEGLTVNKMNEMRQKMPEGTVVRCVKNTLVKRAIEGDARFPLSEEMLQYSNYWFFVPEANLRETVELWTKFVDTSKQTNNAIVGGMFEGSILDAEGVEAVTKLPTKQELMGQTAALLKALPTKLARSLKAADATRLARAVKEAQGQKLARAVDAMKEKL